MSNDMKRPLKHRLKIVTGLGDDKTPLLEESTIDSLLEVLCHRSNRLVEDRELCDRLRPIFREFVYNVVEYFEDSGDLDAYIMTNIMTALITADNHGPSHRGVEDYSTFIRCLNPTDPDADTCFIIGRAGAGNDPDCPMKEMARNIEGMSNVPTEKLHMLHAFHYARSMDIARNAPRILLEDFKRLVPAEIIADSVMEGAFLDVCFSDGAWELYQLKLAA